MAFGIRGVVRRLWRRRERHAGLDAKFLREKTFSAERQTSVPVLYQLQKLV
jgi:hypothetical protein